MFEYNYWNIATGLFTVVAIIGFIIYQVVDGVDSWEAGIKKIFTFLWEEFYEELTGRVPQVKEVREELKLHNEQARELCDRFVNNPFNNPMLKGYVPNYQGMSWYRIESVGLTKEYSKLTRKDLELMCMKIIEKYFTDLVEYTPLINISVLSSTVLCFEVALSDEGVAKLEIRKGRRSRVLGKEEVVLEEEIDIWGE